MAKLISAAIFTIAIVFISAVPSSSGRKLGINSDPTETDLRSLCSNSSNPKECWNVIKSEYYRFDTDTRGVVQVSIDLAIAKANQVHDLLNQLVGGSKDDQLKEKYWQCSKNYNDIIRDLNQAKTMLDSNKYKDIPVQIDDVLQELSSCRHEFAKESFDPAHICNRNREFRWYAELVKAAADRLVEEQGV